MWGWRRDWRAQGDMGPGWPGLRAVAVQKVCEPTVLGQSAHGAKAAGGKGACLPWGPPPSPLPLSWVLVPHPTLRGGLPLLGAAGLGEALISPAGAGSLATCWSGGRAGRVSPASALSNSPVEGQLLVQIAFFFFSSGAKWGGRGWYSAVPGPQAFTEASLILAKLLSTHPFHRWKSGVLQQHGRW